MKPWQSIIKTVKGATYYVEIMKTIDQRDLQKTTKEKQTKTEIGKGGKKI